MNWDFHLMKRHQLSHHCKDIKNHAIFHVRSNNKCIICFVNGVYGVGDQEGHVTINEVSGLKYWCMDHRFLKQFCQQRYQLSLLLSGIADNWQQDPGFQPAQQHWHHAPSSSALQGEMLVDNKWQQDTKAGASFSEANSNLAGRWHVLSTYQTQCQAMGQNCKTLGSSRNCNQDYTWQRRCGINNLGDKKVTWHLAAVKGSADHSPA